MEDLFEFLFGASGRINRARYWRSVALLSIAGLFVLVVLFIAASIAAPLFLVSLVFVFIPWLIWGLAVHTERLHDRDKSAWWLLVFYGVPVAFVELAKAALHAGSVGSALYFILTLAGFVVTVWGFVEIGCLPGTRGPNKYGANPLLQQLFQKREKARWPQGHRAVE